MDKQQSDFYNASTGVLIKKLETMHLEADEYNRAKDLVLRFRDAFKSVDIKHKTFPDEPREPDEIEDRIYPSNGFCRASSLAFCAVMGGAKNGWQPMAIPEMFAPYGPHHYIFHIPTKTVFDLTADQFTHIAELRDIPYKHGIPVSGEFKFGDSPYLLAQATGINLIYEKTTNDLVDFAKTFTDLGTAEYKLPQIVYRLRDAFKSDETYKNMTGKERLSYRPKSEGFCATSSYVIYTMTGGDKVWDMYYVFPMHWWLVHKETHKILDITHDQFSPSALPGKYKNGSKYEITDKNRQDLQRLATSLIKSAGLE